MPKTEQLPLDKATAFRYVHAQGQRLELPGSPAGSNRGAHDAIKATAKQLWGVDSLNDLDAGQLQKLGDFMVNNDRLPTRVDFGLPTKKTK